MLLLEIFGGTDAHHGDTNQEASSPEAKSPPKPLLPQTAGAEVGTQTSKVIFLYHAVTLKKIFSLHVKLFPLYTRSNKCSRKKIWFNQVSPDVSGRRKVDVLVVSVM